ncbi:MAG: peptidylprolyl isomerase [Verrucomicrobia bacterium]|nr:peptidylprolyl isomerase [Verrucomicrobiota bacterium]
MAKWFTFLWTILLPTFLLAEQENPVKQSQVVVFETSMGTFEITLKPEAAPKACENFVGLVKKGYYDGLIFHRVIRNFMIQGGDPTATGAGGASLWGKEFADECKTDVKFDKVGILAMANRGPNTNGSQFFITTALTPWLHMKHTIFGEVTSGYDVVKKIEGVPTAPGDRPLQPIKIQKAYVVNRTQ